MNTVIAPPRLGVIVGCVCCASVAAGVMPLRDWLTRWVVPPDRTAEAWPPGAAGTEAALDRELDVCPQPDNRSAAHNPISNIREVTTLRLRPSRTTMTPLEARQQRRRRAGSRSLSIWLASATQVPEEPSVGAT